MISLRNRRAAFLPSTLTFALLCQAGLASAQSAEGWPFDDKGTNPQAPPAQTAPAPPKSAVQQKLEELYRRDGRSMPTYMQRDAASSAGSQQAPAQQVWVPPQQPARQQPAPQQPAPTAYYVVQPGAPPNEEGGIIRQQLSEYYSSQGRPMPGTYQGWNSAEPARQPIATNAGQVVAPSSAPASPAQPRLIDRLNPFSDYWRKDDKTAPPATPPTYGNRGPQASFQSQSSDWSQPAAPPAPPASPVVQPAVRPSPRVMTVELGPAAPVSTLVPPAPSQPQPTSFDDPPATVASRAAIARRTAEASAATSSPNSAVKVVAAQNEQPLPDAKTKSVAAKGAVPGRGSIQEADDAVAAPEPSKIATADADEPASPSPAPTPAVETEPHKTAASGPSAAKSPAGSVNPSPATQEKKPDADHVAAKAPAKPAATVPDAPKVFEEKQPASELHGPQDITAKMHKLGERVGQRGMKGFCPVALRDRRELVDALPIYSSEFQSKRYYFSSSEAKARFDREPEKYAPVSGGIDVVVKATSDQTVEGSLDFAGWYKDRLLLFSSPESLEAFTLNPVPYAAPYVKTH